MHSKNFIEDWNEHFIVTTVERLKEINEVNLIKTTNLILEVYVTVLHCVDCWFNLNQPDTTKSIRKFKFVLLKLS